MPRAVAAAVQGEKTDRSAILSAPPSVLPDISPTRGEIGSCHRRLSPILQRWQLAKSRQCRAANLPPCGGDVRQDRGGRDGMPACERCQLPLRQIPRMGLAALLGNHPEHGNGNIARRIFIDRGERLRILPVTRDRHLPPNSRIGPHRRQAAHRPSPHPSSAARRRRQRPKPSARAVASAQPLRPPPGSVPPAAAGSAISCGSMPASGPVSTGTPVRTAMPSASTSAASSAALSGVRPRICRLPRAVTSMMPLPCRKADSAKSDQQLRRQVLQRPG